MSGMDGASVVDLLLDLEAEDVIRVTDEDETEWRGVLDYADFTERTPNLRRDDGYVNYSFVMSDGADVETPGTGFGASIIVREENGKWDNPFISYNDPHGESVEEVVYRDLVDLEVVNR